MSADKLADVIEGSNAIGQILPDRAADRVREAFFVIDRNDLPEVEPERPGYAEYVHINGAMHGLMADVEQYDDAIRALVALREYRREHPYIDDDAVEELWKALVDSGLDLDLAEARRLAQQGIRVVEVAR